MNNKTETKIIGFLKWYINPNQFCGFLKGR